MQGRDGGFVLLFALFLTVALGTLSVALLRDVPVRERLAGNVTDKQRALRAAEDALRYAETWLVREQGSVAMPCTGVADASVGGPHVCSGPLAAPSSLPWPARIENLPLPGNQWSGGAPSRSAMYIGEVGIATGGTQRYYEITTVGYGPAGAVGTGAVVVLRSTFTLATAARNLGVQ